LFHTIIFWWETEYQNFSWSFCLYIFFIQFALKISWIYREIFSISFFFLIFILYFNYYWIEQFNGQLISGWSTTEKNKPFFPQIVAVFFFSRKIAYPVVPEADNDKSALVSAFTLTFKSNLIQWTNNLSNKISETRSCKTIEYLN